MSAEAVRVVEQIQEILLLDDVVASIADEAIDSRIRETFAALAEPEFEVAMLGPDYLPSGAEGNGPDGFRAVWEDWTSAFESFRIEVEETIDAGDRVVSLVRLHARTQTGGVPIEATAAAVWTTRAGKLSRVEFHLDRDTAMRAAGLDPDHSSQPKL